MPKGGLSQTHVPFCVTEAFFFLAQVLLPGILKSDGLSSASFAEVHPSYGRCV